MSTKDDLIAIFKDTEKWYGEDAALKSAIAESIKGTRVYMEGDTPTLPTPRDEAAKIIVTKRKTLEVAYLIHAKYPDAKIAIHNFASATNPGGGVRNGSHAQEECLCRTTTLLPVLDTNANWDKYYQFHRARHDQRYTDACIYTPGIVAVKTDDDLPRRMARKDWLNLDVITCAAPNLRRRPSNAMNASPGAAVTMTDDELLRLHEKRARHMLSVAAANKADIIILGAFGCGAFRNNPAVVANAYKNILPDFIHQFKVIEFAI